MRAVVEGLFAFDFSGNANCALSNSATDITDFNELAEKQIRRTRVMNAYLAFFYTRQIEIDKFSQARMVVTPELMISMNNLDGNTSQGFGNTRVSHLATSRFEGTYSSNQPYWADIRLQGRRGLVSKQVLEAAATDLTHLISKHGDAGVMLLDLYLRATKAFQDHNHSLSVINYWTIIEIILNELWEALIDDKAITGKRRKNLREDSRTFSAAVIVETLDFLDRIPDIGYDDITKTRKIRNGWIHSLVEVNKDDAIRANDVCARLLKQAKGLTLMGATGLSLHG
jgi:hypothetical protein